MVVTLVGYGVNEGQKAKFISTFAENRSCSGTCDTQQKTAFGQQPDRLNIQVHHWRWGIYLGWIRWFNPVDFLGDPVEICSLSLGGV